MQEKQAILDMGRTWQFKKRKAHVQTFKDVQQSDKRPCVKQTVSSSASFSPVSPSIITIFIVIIAPLFMPGISIAFSAHKPSLWLARVLDAQLRPGKTHVGRTALPELQGVHALRQVAWCYKHLGSGV